MDTSTGLQLNGSAAGRTLGFVPQWVAAYAVVASGGITAASGLTLGTGKIDVHYKDDTGVLQPCKRPSDDCYNSTSATAMQGDVIQVKWIDDDWAWDVASCPTSWATNGTRRRGPIMAPKTTEAEVIADLLAELLTAVANAGLVAVPVATLAATLGQTQRDTWEDLGAAEAAGLVARWESAKERVTWPACHPGRSSAWGSG